MKVRRAPVSRRRTLVSVLAVCGLCSAVGAAPAGAAAPEAPAPVTVESVEASTATLHGVLNPGKEGEPGTYDVGTYQFLYKASKTECEGGGRAPESPGMSLGAGKEEVTEGLSGLKQGTVYTVCLLAENTEGQVIVGPPVTFMTALAPEAPETLKAESVAGTTATLNGNLKSGGGGTSGYYFQYGSGGSCEGGQATTPGTATSGAVQSEVTGLSPKTRYTFCLVATNAFGSTPGQELSFETTVALPVIESQSASEEKLTNATVSATINPSGAETTCKVQYGTTTAYGSEAPCPVALGEGTAGVPVSVDLTGLEPKVTYHYQFVATNAVGTVEGHETQDSTVTTTSPPVIDSTSAASVYSTSADLEAEINPESFDTHYRFEYISDSGYTGNGNSFNGPNLATSLPAREPDLGAANTDQTAEVHLQALAPETVYHYRAIAVNEFGTTDGPATTFTTPESAPSNTLPDGREYELVSPVNKDGGDAGVIVLEGHNNLNFSRSSVSGDKLMYSSESGFAGPQGIGFVVNYIATRGPDGWTTQPISPPTEHNYAIGLPVPYLSLVFAPELSQGIVNNFDPPLAAGAPPNYQDLYVSDLTDPTNPSYEALNTTTPPNFAPGHPEPEFDMAFVGASTDLSHVVFVSNALLTPNAIPGATVGNNYGRPQYNMYEWVNGQLHLVNISPSPSEAPMPGALAGPGETSLANEASAIDNEPIHWAISLEAGDSGPILEHVVSTSGSRVFFTGVEDQLYVREDGSRTVQVSASQRTDCNVQRKEKEPGFVCMGAPEPDPSGPERAHYWNASADGSAVYFSSCEKLTNDSTAVSAGGCELINTQGASQLEGISGNDLYRFDTVTGRLVDLTVDHNAGDPLGADVQGVVAESEDGSYLYFVAHGDLAVGATSGQDNLYLYHEGTTTFVATLKKGVPYHGEEAQFGEGRCVDEACLGDTSDWSQLPLRHTARVTPDGTHLAFDSKADLTGYDNTVQGEGNCDNGKEGGHPLEEGASACGEIYIYDATTKHLACASCNPSGTRPFGPTTITPPTIATYTPHNFSGDGSRFFFETSEALVSGDTNGVRDVYEYENARPSLISGGTDSSDSYFLDASPSGDDVFFLTRQQLVPADQDQLLDVYDARVDGGFQEVTPSICAGTGCQGVPPTLPIFATPSSVTFKGVGNFPPVPPPTAGKAKPRSKPAKCPNKLRKKKNHGKCVGSARKRAKKPNRRATGRRK